MAVSGTFLARQTAIRDIPALVIIKIGYHPMTIKIVFAALAAVLNLGLIIFTVLRNRHHQIYKIFILLCFCLLMWNMRVVISKLLEIKGIVTSSFILLNIFYPAVTVCLYILPAAALHFIVLFIPVKSKIVHWLVKGAYGSAGLLSLGYILKIIPQPVYGYITELFLLFLLAVALYLIGRAYYHSTQPLEKQRLGLLFIGGLIGVTGALTEDIVMTAGIYLPGIGNVANAFFSASIALSIFNYRFLDLELTLPRISIFLLASLVLFSVSLIISAALKLSLLVPYVHIIIVVTIIMIFGNRIIRFLEAVLFRKLKSATETISELNRALESARNIRDLIDRARKFIYQKLTISKTGIYLYDRNDESYRLFVSGTTHETDPVELPSPSHLVSWFKKNRKGEPLIGDEVRHLLKFGDPRRPALATLHQTLGELEELGYEVCTPLLHEGRIEGLLLLGFKDNDRILNNSDIRFLKILTQTTTLWLQRFEMLEKISQLEQLAALGELSASIAHEVRNPLAIIRSSAQLIDSQTKDSQFTSLIVSECDRLNRIITSLLEYSKSSLPVPQKINVQDTITEWLSEFRNSQDFKTVTISLRAPRNVPNIKFDRDHFKQIILNLLLNAVQAMNGTGVIVLSLSSNSGTGVALTIHDTGPGIASGDRTKIFQPFFSTKPGGSGLGLPITRKLLKLNSATIKFISTPGSGCSVLLNLPTWKK